MTTGKRVCRWRGGRNEGADLRMKILTCFPPRKVATLQLLAGYLGLAGGHVTLMVHSLPHLSRLVHALVQVGLTSV